MNKENIPVDTSATSSDKSPLEIEFKKQMKTLLEDRPSNPLLYLQQQKYDLFVAIASMLREL